LVSGVNQREVVVSQCNLAAASNERSHNLAIRFIARWLIIQLAGLQRMRLRMAALYHVTSVPMAILGLA
jgi:hypothetical protein